MKLAKLLSLVMFILLCVSVSKSSRAQWGFQQGTFTPNPSSLGSGQGAVCDNNTCTINLSGDNGFSVNYSTQLYWTGDGEIQYAANVKGVVTVSGSTPSYTGAQSYARSYDPLPIELRGDSFNGSDNYPAPGTAIRYGLYVDTLSAFLSVNGHMGGYGSPKPYSLAQVSYSLL